MSEPKHTTAGGRIPLGTLVRCRKSGLVGVVTHDFVSDPDEYQITCADGSIHWRYSTDVERVAVKDGVEVSKKKREISELLESKIRKHCGPEAWLAWCGIRAAAESCRDDITVSLYVKKDSLMAYPDHLRIRVKGGKATLLSVETASETRDMETTA